jgi:uncharacterized membrane protein
MNPGDNPIADPALPSRTYARRTVWLASALFAVILGVWLLGTPPGVLGRADAIGYAICHRIDARSFHAHDRALPLCARCTGIYLGVVTGLLTFILRGRGRSGRLPPVRVILVMLAVGATYAVDGLNSYLTLFDRYDPPYAPHNTLRLITGLGFGLTLITLVLPVFNTTTWTLPRSGPPVTGLRDLAGLYAIAGLVAGVVLLQQPALLVAAGLISAGGVVLMFGFIGAIVFLTLSRRENTLVRWRDLIVPGLVGLTFALAVIGAIDLLRYLWTGTWEGFDL